MKLWLTIFVLTGAASGLARAQYAMSAVPEPAELVQRRTQFELRALTSAKTLSEQFANALNGISKESGAAGDYEQAVAAQKRREQVLALYARMQESPTVTTALVLKASQVSRVNGAVNYDRNLDALVSWKKAGTVATWDISRVTPGTYEVILTYAVGDMGEVGRTDPLATMSELTTGGSFEFYEDSSLPGASQNRRISQVSSTGGWTTWQELKLPAIQLTRTSASLALKITNARGTGGVMNLKEIRLVPPGTADAGKTPGSSPGPATYEEDLSQLEAAHLARLKQAVAPVVANYTNMLKSHTDTAAAQKEPEIANELQDEVQRATGIADDPRSILQGTSKKTRSSSTTDGWRELRGASYLPGPENTGDRFRVRHEGQDFFVRLLRVRSPAPTVEDPEVLKVFADYFKITAEEAAAIGKQAQQFTEGALSGSPLTLLTRGSKDPAGDLLVWIRTEGSGDFAASLVDHGLAMIQDLPGKGTGAKLHEVSILTALKQRETAARAKEIPPGAWALSKEE